MEKISLIFKALADVTRLKILIILSKRKICAKGISKHLNISEAAVSQHIKILKETGIIIGEKVGYYVYYDLQEALLSEIMRFVEEMKNNHSSSDFKIELEIPNDCAVSCKNDRNRCCKKTLIK